MKFYFLFSFNILIFLLVKIFFASLLSEFLLLQIFLQLGTSKKKNESGRVARSIGLVTFQLKLHGRMHLQQFEKPAFGMHEIQLQYFTGTQCRSDANFFSVFSMQLNITVKGIFRVFRKYVKYFHTFLTPLQFRRVKYHNEPLRWLCLFRFCWGKMFQCILFLFFFFKQKISLSIFCQQAHSSSWKMLLLSAHNDAFILAEENGK